MSHVIPRLHQFSTQIVRVEQERDELVAPENDNEYYREEHIEQQEELPGEEEIIRDENHESLDESSDESQNERQEKNQETATPQESENDRDSVIRHEGECCTSRQRIPARSLPGRPIGRYETLHPSKKTPFADRVVKTGDVIQYFTGSYLDEQEEWIRATVQPMTKKLQLKYPDYYNIINEQGKEMSIKLQPGGSWRLL